MLSLNLDLRVLQLTLDLVNAHQTLLLKTLCSLDALHELTLFCLRRPRLQIEDAIERSLHNMINLLVLLLVLNVLIPLSLLLQMSLKPLELGLQVLLV